VTRLVDHGARIDSRELARSTTSAGSETPPFDEDDGRVVAHGSVVLGLDRVHEQSYRLRRWVVARSVRQ
jgi:hypothetical protein